MNVRFWKNVVKDPIILACTVLLIFMFVGLLVPPQKRARGVPPPPRGYHYQMVPDDEEFPPGWKLRNGQWVSANPPVPDI